MLVTALEMTPCQQVTTGDDITVALTRSGALYSWGWNNYGQLGHGHTRNESRPREVIVQSNDGTPDPVVQVSTQARHVVAVTKAGGLFTWGHGLHGCLGHNNSCNELRPKRVEHGGFAELFNVCASVGLCHSAAIDSFGLVYTWGNSFPIYSCTPVLIDSLKAYRAVQVVTLESTFVVLDNGQVHYFGNNELQSRINCNKEQRGSFTIRGHKLQSIALGYKHGVMVTMSGAVFGFGWNHDHQLGVVDPSALIADIVSMPSEVFVAESKFKGAARMRDGSDLESLSQ